MSVSKILGTLQSGLTTYRALTSGGSLLGTLHSGLSIYKAVTSGVGSFGGLIFTASIYRVMTPTNISGSTSSEWASHSMVQGKTRSEYLGPGLKQYKCDIILNAMNGVSPRTMLNEIQAMVEAGTVDYLIINNAPVGGCPFKLVGESDTWDEMIRYGLTSCTVSLELEEYA
jgi:hypothetical protein